MLTPKLKPYTIPVAMIALTLAIPSHADGLFDSLFKSIGLNPDSITRTVWQRPSDPDSIDFSANSAADQNQTSDSSIVFNASAPSSAALALIRVQLKDNSDSAVSIYLPIANGQISKKIYFPFGPGTYTISAWQSSNADEYQSLSGWTFVKTIDVTNTDQRDLKYLLPSGEIQSDAPEIVSLARSLTSNSQSDMDKAQAIHDWVSSHIQYDVASYFDGSFKSKVYDASTTLRERFSVCQGYSNLYVALARAAGLRARVVTGAICWPTQTWEQVGNSQPHAWSEVQVNGRWVVVDTTWDSGYVDFATRRFSPALLEKYFDPTPSDFARDHRKLSESPN